MKIELSKASNREYLWLNNLKTENDEKIKLSVNT